YRRMRNGNQRAEVRFDGVSGCLRTPSGGSSRQTVVVVDKGRIRTRLLSPREAARLMGVDDTFWLPKRYNDAYKAMGDGVAVPVVRWLSQQLLVPIAEHVKLSLDHGQSRALLRAAGKQEDIRGTEPQLSTVLCSITIAIPAGSVSRPSRMRGMIL